MKSLLLMLLAGGGLFSGTVVGLLALQGRLNFDGTRGLPVIEHFFAAPPGSSTEPAAESVVPPVLTPELSPVLPRDVGPSIQPGETGGAEPLPVGREEPPEPEPAKAEDPAPVASARTEEPVPPLFGRDPQRRGRLFHFPALESGVTVAELDQLAASVQQLREELERRQAAVEQRAAEIGAREADLQERERAVLAKMREVLQERSKLEEELARFQALYTLVRQSERAQYTVWAERMAALSPDQASAIFLAMWQTEEGKAKAAKIMKLMPREATDEVFAQLTPEQAHAMLDRLASTAVEEPVK